MRSLDWPTNAPYVDKEWMAAHGCVASWCFHPGWYGAMKVPSLVRHNYDGTLLGSMTASDWRAGGLDFDGTNDRVECGTQDPSTGDLSLEAWLKADVWVGASRGIIAKRNAWNDAGVRWMFYYSSAGTLRLGRYGAATTFVTYGVPPASVWLHLVLVHNYGTRTHLYVNGKYVEDRDPITYSSGVAVPIQIGCNQLGSEAFDGQFRKAAIYNRCLTVPEITQLAVDPLALFRRREIAYFFGTMPKVPLFMRTYRNRRVA